MLLLIIIICDNNPEEGFKGNLGSPMPEEGFKGNLGSPNGFP
jgi:hypothetical protein